MQKIWRKNIQSQLEHMSHFHIENQYKIDKKNQSFLKQILNTSENHKIEQNENQEDQNPRKKVIDKLLKKLGDLKKPGTSETRYFGES